MITLLIADDHPLVRRALTHLLGDVEDINVLAAAPDGREAVDMALEMAPDVVLMDLEMPELNGIEATRALREAGSAARIVVLTTFSDRDRIIGALDAGALGYLLKDAEPEEIIRGVRAAARGESPLAPRAASELITARAAPQPAVDLSPREREVLALVAEGLSNKLIARRLEISEKTVKTHLTRVFA
jgi:DNA-binding NarL/FixJ family response regulator